MSPTFDTTKYLADPSDLANKLNKNADDPQLLTTLRRVSNRFRDAVNHPVHLVQDDVYYVSGDGGPILHLPAAPIIGTPTVRCDDQPLTGVQVGRRTGMLQRDGGFPAGLENIEVTYSHGHEKIPGGIQDAIIEVAEAVHTLKIGLASLATGGESATFVQALAAGGSTPAWEEAVAKYRLGQGDQS